MSEIDDMKLMAFVDGELPEAEAEEIREMIANDPVLLSEVQKMEALQHSLKSAVDSTTDTPVPGNILAMLEDENDRRTPDRAAHFVLSDWIRPTAIAASIAAAFTLGLYIQPSPSDQMGLSNNMITALNASLDGESRGDTVILESYLDQAGRFCRTFGLGQAGRNARQGLACRQQTGDWQLLVLVGEPDQQSYFPAGTGADMLLAPYTAAMQQLNDEQELTFLGAE